jgi:valyl-tRNA synthetase
MTRDLPKNFIPQEVESRWYALWESRGYFRAAATSDKPAFAIVMPPPNVTGSLHIGHMLNQTVQDVVVRWKRMQGFNTLWLPGMDHAGIATQWVVERELRTQGKTRHDLGREKFVEHVWEWKKEYGGKILNQIRRIGSSCDWSRERFTLDEGLSLAVRDVFVQLYEEGLIYRGKRLINWCPRCLSALSDLEVKYETADSKLYHIRYPLKDKPGRAPGFIEVATTRPETMLGDTAVAVHPEDKRYLQFKGDAVILPLIGRELPFVPDTAVDPKFGTGVVKVTPAHDLADFDMGQRHNLEQISVIGEDAKITAAGGVYQGLDRFVARKKIVEDLEAQGLLVKVESLANSVGHCERCGTIVEPLLSTQWFVKIKPLADPAIEAVESGRTRFIPPSWANTYFEWMRNIRDWCISRQLWWGHRIPAWYCSCGEIIVSRSEPTKCPKCGSSELRQDSDVLDTWFSSGLWPFSTLGWPQKTDDLKTFYPGAVLITGYDIIFFWVARMMMFGLKFMNDVPFGAVYITGIFRDAQRQKMSKSKGNAVDPLELCDRYGTDAVRFALARVGAPGTDIQPSDDLFESYRNFATKIWNAARFILRYVADGDRVPSAAELKAMDLSLADRWILARLSRAAQEVNSSLEQYNLHEASRTIYRFFWHEFCDWYLEMIKLHPERSKPVLLYVFESALRMLHPFMPFLTEELWQTIPHQGESIMIAEYPKFDAAFADTRVESQAEMIQDVIVKVRNIRAEKNLASKQAVLVRMATEDPDVANLLNGARDYVFRLASVSQLEIVPRLDGNKMAAQAVAAGCALEIPLEGMIDSTAEKTKLEKELDRVRKEIDGLDRKLSNASFVERAPADVVEENRRRLKDYQDQAAKLRSALERLA